MTIQACGKYRLPRRPATTSRAVFLDRDGTLIVDHPYNGDSALTELLPCVPAALRLLRRAGYRLIVVTNQSGIARGYFGESDLERVHHRLSELLAKHQVWIDAFYFCPHHVDGTVAKLAGPCHCRKPGPGMLARAAFDWNVDLRNSWMIGDMATDLEAARAAGCRSIQVSDRASPDIRGNIVTLLDAARLIQQADEASELTAPEARPTTRPG